MDKKNAPLIHNEQAPLTIHALNRIVTLRQGGPTLTIVKTNRVLYV